MMDSNVWHLAAAQVCLLTNPIWVIKTRMQLQRRQHAVGMHVRLKASHIAATAAQQSVPYRGFSHAVKQIAREEGWKGFYRGLGPSLLMVSYIWLTYALIQSL